jgi:4-hydroxy-tetrahydrodipicolinate synthase
MGHLLTEAARGVFAIAVTPFTPDGEIDEASLDSLIAFYLAQGVHGLTFLGMMGEAPKLTDAESHAVVRRALASVNDAVPVIVGVSGSSLATMKALAHASMTAGAAGVMVAPAAGLKTDEQILGYYARVLATLGPDVPIVYQDYPQSTGVQLSIPVFLELVRTYPQIKMLKHEDCPGLSKITRIRTESEAQGLRRVSILVGNGGLYYPLELRRGADGAMTGYGYPQMLVKVYEQFAAGDADGAEDLFDAHLPLVRYEQQPGIGLAIRKELLRRQGAIRSATLRQPGPALAPADIAELDHLIARVARQVTLAVA